MSTGVNKKQYKYEVSLPNVGTVVQNNEEYSLVSLDIYLYRTTDLDNKNVYYYTFSDLGLIF